MTDRDHARALLDAADRDLRALVAMVPDNAFADEIVGFHAQQAVEKALKAWLAFEGRPYPWTHDLSALLGLIEDAGHEVERLRPLVRLNVFAVRFRYESLGPTAPLRGRAQIGGGRCRGARARPRASGLTPRIDSAAAPRRP